MSTKIYNAYKYTGKNIESLFRELQNFKKKYVEWKYGCVLFYLMDNCYREGLKIEAVEGWQIIELMKKYTDIGGWDVLNMQASVMVYPYKGDLYIQFFGVDRLDSKFKNKKDFHYQDQTDKPSIITEKQWENRSKTWDKILGATHTPIDSGLSLSLDTFNIRLDIASRVAEYIRDKFKGEKSEDIK
jgi:hypothetical protein